MALRRRVVVLLFTSAVLTLRAAEAAFAQSSSEPAGTPSPAPTPGKDNPRIAVALILLGAFATFLLYWYLNGWRRDTTRLTEKVLKDLKTLPDWVHVSGGVNVEPDGGREATATKLEVVGSPVVAVGRPEVYRATLDGKPVSVEWEVKGDATVSARNGEETSLTATKPGQIRLEAKAGDETAFAIIGAVTAPAATPAGRLPLVGGGYGGLTVALVAITFAAALTAIGKLPDAALATLLGTVVSYFFAQRGGGGDGATGGGGNGNPPPPPE